MVELFDHNKDKRTKSVKEPFLKMLHANTKKQFSRNFWEKLYYKIISFKLWCENTCFLIYIYIYL